MAQGIEERFQANYADILKLARARLSRERAPISTGTLAHELYLNLRDRADLNFPNPGAFLAYASRAMRSLLVDMARERLAQKRHAELMPLTLGAEVPDLGGTPEQLVALDDALSALARIDERKSQVVELRFFGGLSTEEVAEALNVSTKTVLRDWQLAKMWLFRELSGRPHSAVVELQ